MQAAAIIQAQCELESTTSPPRVIRHPSSAMTNDIAAWLLTRQNTGSQHLYTLLPAIALDLKPTMTYSAAQVIAGLPVFEESITTPTQYYCKNKFSACYGNYLILRKYGKKRYAIPKSTI